MTEEGRRLHNKELYDLYCSLNIIRVIKSRRMRWVENVARMGDGRGAFMVLARRPEAENSFGRPRRKWEDNIKMNVQEVGLEHGMD